MKDKNSVDSQLPFGARNYLWILSGIGLILVGYFTMVGEPFIDATEFSRALYVSPILIIAGHVFIVVGIVKKPNKDDESESTPQGEENSEGTSADS